jgi:hypothetical protein
VQTGDANKVPLFEGTEFLHQARLRLQSRREVNDTTYVQQAGKVGSLLFPSHHQNPSICSKKKSDMTNVEVFEVVGLVLVGSFSIILYFSRSSGAFLPSLFLHSLEVISTTFQQI